MLNNRMTEAITLHAKEEYPKESCGLVVKVGGVKRYIRCTNVSESREDEFVISAEEYSQAEDMGDIVAVVHSHPDATTQPSLRDRAICSEMGLPWIITSYPEGDIRTIVPEKAPLIGRPFCHGTDWDCYGLIRDYYKETFNIKLNRYNHDSYWWNEGKSFYIDNFEREGFYKVADGSLNTGDLILMQIRADVPNHGAIYLGDGKILHHTFGRLSSVELYGGYWLESTICTIRHKEVVDVTKT